jgi:hypothetical protein
MFGESTGPVVNNFQSDAPLSRCPLGGTRKCKEQGDPGQTTGFSRAVRLAIRKEANVAGL